MPAETDQKPKLPASVLVLGGNGFIGRYAVSALLNAGHDVVIGTRFPGTRTPRTVEASAASNIEQRRVRLEELDSLDDWLPLVDDVDAVLNCVGILRQRPGETYDAVHRAAPSALAAACKRQNKRFVHVSALGLEPPARSRFLTSKLAGEAAIRKHGGDWAIARPSLLDGVGGFGASWLRMVSRLPLFVVPADARGHIAALDVGELGEALARLSLDSADNLRFDQSRIFELGGPQAWTFRDYIFALRRGYTDRTALCIPVPGFLARIGAHLCDVFHFSPFSFGHWELLQRDNVPSTNRLPELLRREPVSVVNRTLP